MGPFGLTCFLAYAKQFIQINKIFKLIHNLVKVVYDKIAYKDTILLART